MERHELLTSNKKKWERALQAHNAKEVRGWPMGEGRSVKGEPGSLGVTPPVAEFASFGVPILAQPVKDLTMRMWVQSLALLGGLRVQCCCRLRCRSQMQLGSVVAMAVV